MRFHSADLSGERFGNLVVLRYVGYVGGATIWTCQCDCGKFTDVRSTNLKRGDTKSCGCLRQRRRSLAERFWQYVEQTKSGCWIWTGSKDQRNYGQIGSGGHNSRCLKAHRVSWQINRGPITDGLWVLHRCDNPPCVNPDHLFLGTRQMNVDDCVAKGRNRNNPKRGSDNRKAIFTEEQIRAIRRAATSGIPRPVLAKQYGTSRQNIGFIVRRDTWAHLPESE